MDDDVDSYSTHAQDVNVEQFSNETALRIRLDTDPLKYKLQMFLEGKQEKLVRNNNGQIVPKVIPRGNAMANDVGVQRIMAFFESAVNSQVVQGNFDRDQYEWFMTRIRRDINLLIFKKMYEYGINEDEYGVICDIVSNTIELFVSRTKNDGERKSYANFMSHFENTSAGQSGGKKSGLWDNFKVGK